MDLRRVWIQDSECVARGARDRAHRVRVGKSLSGFAWSLDQSLLVYRAWKHAWSHAWKCKKQISLLDHELIAKIHVDWILYLSRRDTRETSGAMVFPMDLKTEQALQWLMLITYSIGRTMN